MNIPGGLTPTVADRGLWGDRWITPRVLGFLLVARSAQVGARGLGVGAQGQQRGGGLAGGLGWGRIAHRQIGEALDHPRPLGTEHQVVLQVAQRTPGHALDVGVGGSQAVDELVGAQASAAHGGGEVGAAGQGVEQPFEPGIEGVGDVHPLVGRCDGAVRTKVVFLMG